MDEQELLAAWKTDDSKESLVFENNSGKYSEIAKSNSNDLFARIRKNMIIEGSFTLILSIAFPFIFWSNDLFFWIVTAFVVVGLGLSTKIYGTYLTQIKAVNESSIVESLLKKRLILRRYMKQLHFYTYILGPIGYCVGFAIPLFEGGEISTRLLLIKIALGLPFLFLTMLLMRKYKHALYGKHLVTLEALCDSMVEE